MPHLRVSSRLGRVVLAVVMLAAGVGIGTGAMVVAQNNGTVYYACVNNGSGTIKMISETGTCQGSDMRIVWNQQGPQGETGDQGPQGVPGVAGPQGSPGVSGYVRHSQRHEDVTFSPGGWRYFDVDCPAGKKVVGGGGTPYNVDGGHLIVVNGTAHQDNRWSIKVLNLNPFEESTALIYVMAICVDSQ